MAERRSRQAPLPTARRQHGGRRALALTAALSLTALLAPLVWRPVPRLVWNASASSPIGLYRIGTTKGLRAGDMALAWPPAKARALGAERHYVPRNVPLVKHVAAVAGDVACARGAAITVNGRRVGLRRAADPAGRAMPWSWRGCARLRGGDLLLLSPGEPLAFDGRYFGISRGSEVLGRASLLWPR